MKNKRIMKRILLVLGVLTSLLAARVVLAQTPASGVVEYEVKINMHRNIPAEREGIKQMIPEFNTSKYKLFFNGTESWYEPILDEEEDSEIEANGGGMRMVFRRPSIEVYTNQTESLRIRKQEFFGKNYLIMDTLKVLPWKFTGETKTIMGQLCQKAVYVNEARKQNVVAWFSPMLRPFLGPDTFNSLPGIILQVDINDGERILTALKVESRELKKNELKRPEDGVKISDAEFRKIMDEQMKRMNRNGGGVIIRN